MSQHSAFLLGRALAVVRRDDPALFDRLLGDVSPADLPAVLRGLEDPVRCTERADDLRTFRELVRTR